MNTRGIDFLDKWMAEELPETATNDPMAIGVLADRAMEAAHKKGIASTEISEEVPSGFEVMPKRCALSSSNLSVIFSLPRLNCNADPPFGEWSLATMHRTPTGHFRSDRLSASKAQMLEGARHSIDQRPQLASCLGGILSRLGRLQQGRGAGLRQTT
ncbi:DUF768 domain-containing protein [Mesorhizobium sp. NZP2298]|uniref:DUF768 domain-containing protein n=1 Tax=Mesorhizobium sp. NZP2298 TaxID=2483403 RepID=UPI0015575265|nr:DUF768 domain-containing protein [Mesorhizobium sp. NZP2298]QKC98273.1 DUF768 domain-containing protein [Mesorhizobium sp. NZP2298]